MKVAALYFAWGIQLAPSRASLLQINTGTASRSSFDELSCDSAVANTNQITVEAILYAQVFVAFAVSCGRSSSHRLLADPDPVGKSKTSTCEKDGERKPIACFHCVPQRHTCNRCFSRRQPEKDSRQKESVAGCFGA
jgi:hypothetical protein